MRLQQLLSYVRKACDDYDMLKDGDRIAVGISGGKDSLSLLIALKALQKFYPTRYELEAITVSLGLEETEKSGVTFADVHKLCKELEVNYTILNTDIGKIIFDIRKEKNPCSLCAKMRKGALNDEAKRLGCNKIAYGHNKDDAIETLILSLFYEARINCFSPVSYLDRKDLQLIRPLLYVPEKEIISFAQENRLPVVKSQCRVDGLTKRQEAKEFIKEYSERYDSFDEKIFGAIKRSDIKGWKRV